MVLELYNFSFINMENNIQKIGENAGVFFSLKEGSNYKVLMTYDRAEIVEFEQFRRIAQLLNASEHRFITINQRIVNASTIIDISPTDDKTELQKEELKKNPPQELIVDDGTGKPIKISEIVQ